MAALGYRQRKSLYDVLAKGSIVSRGFTAHFGGHKEEAVLRALENQAKGKEAEFIYAACETKYICYNSIKLKWEFTQMCERFVKWPELLDGEEEKEDIKFVPFPGRKWVIKSRINKSRDSNINILFRWKQVKLRKKYLKHLAGDWTRRVEKTWVRDCCFHDKTCSNISLLKNVYFLIEWT